MKKITLKVELIILICLAFTNVYSQTTDLFFSEYIEGKGYNKAIEIYNGTGKTVDLSNYTLVLGCNGSQETYRLNLSGSLNNNEVFIIKHSNASEISNANISDHPIMDFNGDDHLKLLKNGIEIDRIGIEGTQESWGKNKGFIRKPNIVSPKTGNNNPNTNGEWIVLAYEDYSNLGTHEIVSTTVGDLKIHITEDGKLGVKTTSIPQGFEMAVNGKAIFKEVKVETTWADFVFKPDYKLRSLKEVEAFIKKNGHLPEIPSEKVVHKQGISVGDMNAKFLQKIEELTLYMIQLKKENEELRREINNIKK